MAHGNVPKISYDTLTLRWRKDDPLLVAIGVQQSSDDMISQDKPFKQGSTISWIQAKCFSIFGDFLPINQSSSKPNSDRQGIFKWSNRYEC